MLEVLKPVHLCDLYMLHAVLCSAVLCCAVLCCATVSHQVFSLSFVDEATNTYLVNIVVQCILGVAGGHCLYDA